MHGDAPGDAQGSFDESIAMGKCAEFLPFSVERDELVGRILVEIDGLNNLPLTIG